MLKYMADNTSVVDGESSMRKINERVILVQVLVSLFLFINFILITTFFMKDFFYTTMRYILFAITLLSDSVILTMSNVMLLSNYFTIPLHLWVCFIIFAVSSLYTFVTPVTLTAMTLERYVAICMPLRHVELCSTCSAQHCILIIHGLSSVPCIVILSSFFVLASLSIYKQYKICSLEIFILRSWQRDLRSAISLVYFLIMFMIIVFSYVKIMKVAKAASGKNKKSTLKGLRTVILHAFQLLLCLIQLCCPFVEAAVLQIDFMLFINVRYFNYIMFNLVPRCLSPLIYGLRDEKFCLALKYYALCGLYKNK